MKKNFAFSGLEAAIVLIAFVVVAAVFAYTTLGAGFFASDKAQQVTYSGMKGASAVLYPEGSVYGILDETTKQLDEVYFSIAIPDTGTAQNLELLTITYTQSWQGNPRVYTYGGANPGPLEFEVEGDFIMHPSEKRIIHLKGVKGPIEGEFFTIELRPSIGSAAILKRWIPVGYSGGVIL